MSAGVHDTSQARPPAISLAEQATGTPRDRPERAHGGVRARGPAGRGRRARVVPCCHLRHRRRPVPGPPRGGRGRGGDRLRVPHGGVRRGLVRHLESPTVSCLLAIGVAVTEIGTAVLSLRAGCCQAGSRGIGWPGPPWRDGRVTIVHQAWDAARDGLPFSIGTELLAEARTAAGGQVLDGAAPRRAPPWSSDSSRSRSPTRRGGAGQRAPCPVRPCSRVASATRPVTPSRSSDPSGRCRPAGSA